MSDYYVHPLAVVDDGANIGKNTKIWHFTHIRSSAIIGSDVIIGKNAYIDINVKIGSKVKIQNNVSVYSGVTIDDDVFVGPHAVFTNDLKPRAIGDWESVETKINRGASIGANSVIVCGNTLGSYCMIGAGSVVTKNVPSYALVYGNPARFQGIVCSCGEKIADKNAENKVYVCKVCKTEIQFSHDKFT